MYTVHCTEHTDKNDGWNLLESLILPSESLNWNLWKEFKVGLRLTWIQNETTFFLWHLKKVLTKEVADLCLRKAVFCFNLSARLTDTTNVVDCRSGGTKIALILKKNKVWTSTENRWL